MKSIFDAGVLQKSTVKSNLSDSPDNNSGRFEAVVVLIISWNNKDHDMQMEVSNFKAMFECEFFFEVEELVLNTARKRTDLEGEALHHGVARVLTKCMQIRNEGKHPLLIIAYVGHGQREDPNSHLQIGPAQNESRYNWNYVQASVTAIDIDVLFILDCCYAGLPAQEPLAHHGSSIQEVLAACQGDQVTNDEGMTYTVKLTRLLSECVRSVGTEQRVLTENLHRQMYRRHRLNQSGEVRDPAFCRLKMPNMDKVIELMPIYERELETVKRNFGPWRDWPAACKRRQFKEKRLAIVLRYRPLDGLPTKNPQPSPGSTLNSEIWHEYFDLDASTVRDVLETFCHGEGRDLDSYNWALTVRGQEQDLGLPLTEAQQPEKDVVLFRALEMIVDQSYKNAFTMSKGLSLGKENHGPNPNSVEDLDEIEIDSPATNARKRSAPVGSTNQSRSKRQKRPARKQ